MELSKIFPIKVPQECEGLRLDVFLSQNFSEVSRSRWRRLIDEGAIQRNTGEVLKAAQNLKADWILELNKKVQVNSQKPMMVEEGIYYQGPEIPIIYSDENLLVISKPVGLVVHPGAGVEVHQTLVGWLLQNKWLEETWAKGLLKIEDEAVEDFRPGIVHRLDKGTSGLMVVARNPLAHERLSEQFQKELRVAFIRPLLWGILDFV